MKNIVFVVGTRPNFMKVAPMLKEVERNYLHKINPILIHTGQHYDKNMSDVFFDQLGMPISPVLFSISPGTIAQQISEIIKKFDDFIASSPKIDLVVVVGDVTSSVAAALAATKANIPIAHVEAGLRSFDKTMPEEMNRIIIDSISSMFFTTEQSADDNLASEGHSENVYRVGNVMIDTLVHNLPAARKLNAYESYGLKSGEYILSTIHRVSNISSKRKLSAILEAMEKASHICNVLFLAHPGTQKKIKEFGLETDNIIIRSSVGYLENISLMENAKMIVTDSGGIQEETAFLGVPCVTLRKSTERPVTVDCGNNIIAGEDESLYEQTVLSALQRTASSKVEKIPMWDGKTSERIMKIIANRLLQEQS